MLTDGNTFLVVNLLSLTLEILKFGILYPLSSTGNIFTVDRTVFLSILVRTPVEHSLEQWLQFEAPQCRFRARQIEQHVQRHIFPHVATTRTIVLVETEQSFQAFLAVSVVHLWVKRRNWLGAQPENVSVC